MIRCSDDSMYSTLSGRRERGERVRQDNGYGTEEFNCVGLQEQNRQSQDDFVFVYMNHNFSDFPSTCILMLEDAMSSLSVQLSHLTDMYRQAVRFLGVDGHDR